MERLHRSTQPNKMKKNIMWEILVIKTDIDKRENFS